MGLIEKDKGIISMLKKSGRSFLAAHIEADRQRQLLDGTDNFASQIFRHYQIVNSSQEN